MIENKLEFHPENRTCDYRKKARVLAEQAVKQASNASAVASLSGEIVLEHKRYQEALVALTKAHKDQVFARKRKIAAVHAVAVAKSYRERVLKGLQKAEELFAKLIGGTDKYAGSYGQGY